MTAPSQMRSVIMTLKYRSTAREKLYRELMREDASFIVDDLFSGDPTILIVYQRPDLDASG